MIDVNSNCSRVDAVKARAAQLRMELDQVPRRAPEDDKLKAAKTQVESLENAVKKGDAATAERALSTATPVVQAVQTESALKNPLRDGLDVYA